ncbi:hypothetical protein GORHZ_180_00050 [Gordonia rhizosphera NBRC 16068]|uniref:Uncharacterized protein n=1 Tax=Gordonia rhizosphera NBRC 16068 TaxID=1108045 RepID=K6WFB3_9ACTN|nr:hypothetical protein GORHZ_180_00050 [Gordonia rhizosphera NBRC 16068]
MCLADLSDNRGTDKTGRVLDRLVSETASKFDFRVDRQADVVRYRVHSGTGHCHPSLVSPARSEMPGVYKVRVIKFRTRKSDIRREGCTD